MSREGNPKKLVRRVICAAEAAGWRIVKQGAHYKLYPTNKTLPMMVLSHSPSRSGEAAIVDDCRRRGLKIDGSTRHLTRSATVTD